MVFLAATFSGAQTTSSALSWSVKIADQRDDVCGGALMAIGREGAKLLGFMAAISRMATRMARTLPANFFTCLLLFIVPHVCHGGRRRLARCATDFAIV